MHFNVFSRSLSENWTVTFRQATVALLHKKGRITTNVGTMYARTANLEPIGSANPKIPTNVKQILSTKKMWVFIPYDSTIIERSW